MQTQISPKKQSENSFYYFCFSIIKILNTKARYCIVVLYLHIDSGSRKQPWAHIEWDKLRNRYGKSMTEKS